VLRKNLALYWGRGEEGPRGRGSNAIVFEAREQTGKRKKPIAEERMGHLGNLLSNLNAESRGRGGGGVGQKGKTKDAKP